MKLTPSQAKLVWFTLVDVCGADRDQDAQDDFVRLSRDPNLGEYRFQGTLGFGGKVYMENPPRVSCYREDETPERRKVVERANAMLVALARQWAAD